MTNLAPRLRKWYLAHHRPLPWRKTRDPYRVWVSEIILQQTRVNQGLDYYHRFLRAFPDVQALAAASQREVMNQWQGLGYYSRARNMHHTAKVIQTQYAGKFPETYPELLKLKGIGPYTAAAIASIAFDLPHALVDGNVFRVLARFFAVSTPVNTAKGKQEFEKIAASLLDQNDPATHNQAMMELGALVCKPVNPDCHLCPVASHCKAFAARSQSNYPVKAPRAARRVRHLHYFFVTCNNAMAIQKREGNDIWKGLYQLPLIEAPAALLPGVIHNRAPKPERALQNLKPCKTIRHLLTHQELQLSFYHLNHHTNLHIFGPDQSTIEFVKLNSLINYPFPQPLHKVIGAFIKQAKSENQEKNHL